MFSSLAGPLIIYFLACSNPPTLVSLEKRSQSTSNPAENPAIELEGIDLLQWQAQRLRPLVKTKLANALLDEVEDLPRIKPRVLSIDRANRKYYNERTVRQLTDEQRAGLAEHQVDEQFYYTTKYGTPLAYVRVLELIGQQKLNALDGKRVMDFGYGSIGQLRLMAQCGADVVGVEVDPMLAALYGNPSDQGRVPGSGGRDGRLKLVDGKYPAEPEIKQTVGGGYDLITSKNTLKNGFFHPERPVPPERLMQLGVDDETFVKTLHDALKPGGYLMIYNICPAPSKPDEPYKHWADGRCPFPREMWESAGFTVLAFDKDDTPAVREMGRALGWDHGPGAMDLEKDLFATYTLVRRATD